MGPIDGEPRRAVSGGTLPPGASWAHLWAGVCYSVNGPLAPLVPPRACLSCPWWECSATPRPSCPTPTLRVSLSWPVTLWLEQGLQRALGPIKSCSAPRASNSNADSMPSLTRTHAFARTRLRAPQRSALVITYTPLGQRHPSPLPPPLFVAGHNTGCVPGGQAGARKKAESISPRGLTSV